MKLRQLLSDMALGELQGSPAVETGTYNILPAYLPKIIQSLNRALDYFYTVFPFKQSNLIIQLYSGLSHYYLTSKYAMSNLLSTEKVRYIMDSPEYPFRDDLIKVLAVQDMEGNQLPINDYFSPYSVMLPEYNCIHVPNMTEGQLSVLYRAKHPEIPYTEPLDLDWEINIPASFQSALQAYVACLFYQNMGGSKHNESNAYYAKFRTLVEELQRQGLGVEEGITINQKPYMRGWI